MVPEFGFYRDGTGRDTAQTYAALVSEECAQAGNTMTRDAIEAHRQG